MTEPSNLQPFREGLFQLEPPRLIGSRCFACGTRVFPARTFCPACDSEAEPATVALAAQGTVFSYTIVRQAPGHRPVPYTLAYVDLDDGVRVMAQVEHAPADVRIGLRVALVLRPTVAETGDQPRLTYSFVGLRSPEEAA